MLRKDESVWIGEASSSFMLYLWRNLVALWRWNFRAMLFLISNASRNLKMQISSAHSKLKACNERFVMSQLDSWSWEHQLIQISTSFGVEQCTWERSTWTEEIHLTAFLSHWILKISLKLCHHIPVWRHLLRGVFQYQRMLLWVMTLSVIVAQQITSKQVKKNSQAYTKMYLASRVKTNT